MTASPTWSVFCDKCGNWVAQEATAPLARATARLNGWLLRPKKRGGDLCPGCREKS
jgi:hypothetical protein